VPIPVTDLKPGDRLRAGQKVLIHGESSWGVGLIEDIHARDQLPPLPGLDVAAVREILAEWGMERVAIISHQNRAGRPVMFAAMETTDGVWRDLNGQLLLITPAAMEGGAS
jgi:hypothetical protein